MSITFANVNFDINNLFKSKRDWVLIFSVGIILSTLFNLWLFYPNMDSLPFTEKLLTSLIYLGGSSTWGLAFGFAGGIVAFKADFIEQFVMTVVAAHVTGFIMGFLTIFFQVYYFGIPFLSFSFVISIVMGFVPGFICSVLLDKYIYKTAEKEIIEKNYVNYASLDEGKRM